MQGGGGWLDTEPIDPEQHDDLKGSTDEEINVSPGVTTHGDVVKRSINIGWKEQDQNRGGDPSRKTSEFRNRKPNGQCELQNSR